MKRTAPLAGLLVAALVLVGCMSPDENAAFAALNADRNANALPSLVANETLVTKAQKWAEHLLANSGGVCSLATLKHSNLYDGMPAGASEMAENVGCITVRNSPRDAVAPLESAFMASPAHRDNILGRSYNNGGVGMASRDIGGGVLLVFEAQEFARL